MFFMLAAALLIFSCSPKSYYTDQNGVRPKSKSFFSYSKDPYRLENTSIIDTNCIYVFRSGLMVYPNDSLNADSVADTHVYFRFFTNGRLKCEITDKYPGLAEVNNIRSGAAGYYRIRDGMVYVQYIGTDGSLVKKTGKVVDGMLHLYYGMKAFDTPELFEKRTVSGLTFDQPDW